MGLVLVSVLLSPQSCLGFSLIPFLVSVSLSPRSFLGFSLALTLVLYWFQSRSCLGLGLSQLSVSILVFSQSSLALVQVSVLIKSQVSDHLTYFKYLFLLYFVLPMNLC